MLGFRLGPLGCAVLLCACAPLHQFDFTSARDKTTELRQRKLNDFVEEFGEPNSITSFSTKTGRFDNAVYVDDATGCLRLMQLEFRDGLLNGYKAFSTCAFDTTRVVPELRQATFAQLDGIHQAEAAGRFGRPAGKIACPSRLASEDWCKEGTTEVWLWLEVPQAPRVGRGAELVARNAVLAFNDQGLVIDFIQAEATLHAR